MKKGPKKALIVNKPTYEEKKDLEAQRLHTKALQIKQVLRNNVVIFRLTPRSEALRTIRVNYNAVS